MGNHFLRFGNEIAGVEDLGTTGRGGDMEVRTCIIITLSLAIQRYTNFSYISESVGSLK